MVSFSTLALQTFEARKLFAGDCSVPCEGFAGTGHRGGARGQCIFPVYSCVLTGFLRHAGVTENKDENTACSHVHKP